MTFLVFIMAVYIGWKLRKIHKLLLKIIEDYKR